MTTISGHYGRDYTSKAKLLADWNADRDFIVRDLFSRYAGKAINRQDAETAGITSLQARYKQDTMVCCLTFKNGTWKA